MRGRIYERSASGDSDGTDLEIDLGGPVAGRVWDVTDIVLVAEADPFTKAACTPWIATGSEPVGPSMLRDVDQRATTGVPYAQDYGGVIFVIHPAHLIVGASGAGSGTYVATAQIRELKAGEFEE
jgi:hypothetical protein